MLISVDMGCHHPKRDFFKLFKCKSCSLLQTIYRRSGFEKSPNATDKKGILWNSNSVHFEQIPLTGPLRRPPFDPQRHRDTGNVIGSKSYRRPTPEDQLFLTMDIIQVLVIAKWFIFCWSFLTKLSKKDRKSRTLPNSSFVGDGHW